MYDQDGPHNLAATAATGGLLGISAWMSWAVAGVFLVVLISTFGLRYWALRKTRDSQAS
jgi:hypothetical protein